MVETLESRRLLTTGAGVDVSGIATRVDRVVTQLMEQNHIPGMAVAITYNGEVVVAKGYGVADAATGAPATASTGFAIGSVTKTFTADAVLLLLQHPSLIKKAGITSLEIDRPISDYLTDNSDFTLPALWKGITTRQLLNMSSGIQDAGTIGVPWYEVINHIGKDPLLFPPGTAYLYSNANYWLLGELVTQLTEQTYNDFLTEHVLQPLGLSQTVLLTGAGTSIPGQAVGYQQYDPQSGTWTLPRAYYSGAAIFSAGALVSTANDLGKYLSALWHRELLSSSLYNLMWTPTPLPNFKNPTIISTPGLGWCDGQGVEVTSQGLVINKDGGVPGFSSQVSLYLGQGFGIAISQSLSPNVNSPQNPAIGALRNEIIDALMTGAIAGVVYADPNGRGSLESGDAPLGGWQVYLDANNNGQLDPGETSTVTNSQGAYQFQEVEPGSVVVRLVPPGGWASITPATGSYALTLQASEIRDGLDFGVGMIPRVTELARQGRGRTLAVTLRFNEPLNVATASNLDNYSVLLTIRNRRLGTKGLVPVRLRNASYNPNTNTVTLTSRRTPLLLNRALEVVVKGTGLKGANSLALDGSGNGRPGTDYVGILAARSPGRPPLVR